MKRSISVLVLVLMVIGLGCMHGRENDPVTPATTQHETGSQNSSVQLWGIYDISLDEAAQEFIVTPLRGADFTCNVVNFLNNSSGGVAVMINSIDGDEIDCRITLTHPFPGLDQYWGFDVMGVFIGQGSETADWNTTLQYPGPDDQQLLNPDGFTRWFNPNEFDGGMPLLSYTKGNLATPNYLGSATLMPYKYFGDSIGANDDLWTEITDPGYSRRGVFTTGANSRQYILKFPASTGIKFNYAVVAHWEANINDPAPPASVDDFPIEANALEAMAFNIDTSATTLWWNESEGGGGTLIADVSILDWDAEVSGSGQMEQYRIILSSDIFDTPYAVSPSEMTPVASGDYFHTYHVEIDPDTLNGNDVTLWVIAEYPDLDYTNDFGVPNDADGPLQACFRYDFTITDDSPGNDPPVIESGVDGPTPVSECDSEIYSVTASDSDGDDLTYTWSVVADGEPDDFNITGEDDTYSINWQDYGDGFWSVNCQVSDGINPPVTATALTVEATYEENCCPFAPNAAYEYTQTPTTGSSGCWAYITPIVDYDSDENCIDMDFMHDGTDRLVVNGRDGLNRIGSVHPNLGTHGSDSTIYVIDVETMSIDVGMDNRIVYVEFDDSVLDPYNWERRLFPQRTDIVTGSDVEFHVFDTETSSEIGSGFVVGERIQAVDIDAYGTIWIIDVENEMHCFEESGSTYVENTGRNFDMDDNGSAMEGYVHDFVINYYNEAFYLLTNGDPGGMLYRVECDGEFISSIDGNSNPAVGFWDVDCNDRADIVIDNFDDDGEIHDGEQDAQILCFAEIVPSGYTSEKIGITRIDASLGNDIWYQFVGGTYTAYGVQAAAINGITNTMYTKSGGTFGNQRSVHIIYTPSGEWF